MKSKPKVRVTLHSTLRHLSQLTTEPEVFEVRAANPLECLEIMLRRYPSMRRWTHDRDGQLQPAVLFFVDYPERRKKLPRSQFSKSLKDGDELIIAFGLL